MAARTAGIIIIGDEVLKGQVADTNSHFMSRRFHEIGVKLLKISVIPDTVEDISKEVLEFSGKYDIVVTTGGIGPTHDDMTYKGVAAAFGESLVKNKELVDFWKDFYMKVDDGHPMMKMTLVPKSASIVHPKVPKRLISKSSFPIVVVHNVFIFPGVPKFLEPAFQALEKEHFEAKTLRFHGRKLYLNTDESRAVKALDLTVKTYPSVEIGSYPVFGNHTYFTKITLESTDEKLTNEAVDFLKSHLDPHWIVPDGELIGDAELNLKDLIEAKKMGEATERIAEAAKIIEKCFKEYDSSEVFLSFNGGKDCTALLHLTYALMQKFFKGKKPPKIQAVYFRGEDPFPEVEQFISDASQRYNLNLIIKKAPIKPALEELVKEKPKWKAVLMGTRRSDPFSNGLEHFQFTDDGWPRLMRVFPLLDWHYDDVWHFLRTLSIPYCTLYDEGYTSLGNVHNTVHNPSLMYHDSEGSVKYHPAFMLKDVESERQGRRPAAQSPSKSCSS